MMIYYNDDIVYNIVYVYSMLNTINISILVNYDQMKIRGVSSIDKQAIQIVNITI